LYLHCRKASNIVAINLEGRTIFEKEVLTGYNIEKESKNGSFPE
jgi:hypothetical protein